MKRFWFVLAILIFVAPVYAIEFGDAYSPQELREAQEEFREYLRDLNTNDDEYLWKGVFVYCVCAGDRGRIIYATDVYRFSEGGGTADRVSTRLRRWAAENNECMRCFRRPMVVYIKAKARYLTRY